MVRCCGSFTLNPPHAPDGSRTPLVDESGGGGCGGCGGRGLDWTGLALGVTGTCKNTRKYRRSVSC